MATEATNQRNARQLFDHFGAENPFTEREAFDLLWPNLDYDDNATRDRLWARGLRTSMRLPGGAAATGDHYLARADGGHMEPAPGGSPSKTTGPVIFTQDLVLLAKQYKRAKAHRPESPTWLEVLRVIGLVAAQLRKQHGE
jgi:hypothetical protein